MWDGRSQELRGTCKKLGNQQNREKRAETLSLPSQITDTVEGCVLLIRTERRKIHHSEGSS